MDGGTPLSPEMKSQLKELGINEELTMRILGNFNRGRYDAVEPVHVTDLPRVDGERILDLTKDFEYSLPLEKAKTAIERIGIPLDLSKFGRIRNERLLVNQNELAEIGRRLYPAVAYGILNGGSATSYTDLTKNRAFSSEVYDICKDTFARVAALSTGRAKGITPAFVHPDGSPGPSYVELKMRSLLIEELRYRTAAQTQGPGLPPMFQMTSVNNDEEISAAYASYRKSPLLNSLIEESGIDVTAVMTGVQPMIAAFTHDREGRPKGLFTKAYGEEGRMLALPGGHGQNFEVLKDVYRELYRRGKRFVVLGNVDNLGNTIDPVEIALLALSDKQAGFDFAFKTPVDVKGGILVVDQRGRLDCADIGPAISPEEVLQAEATGVPILFNCATGVFNLKYLSDNIESIVDELPMRWSNQVKDAGAYSQAEQVTWEIIGMLDDFYIFGVDKYRRFLAAKLLVEGLMTSGIGIEDPRYPTDENPAKDLKKVASQLHEGLKRQLVEAYGMKLEGERWQPASTRELLS